MGIDVLVFFVWYFWSFGYFFFFFSDEPSFFADAVLFKQSIFSVYSVNVAFDLTISFLPFNVRLPQTSRL